MYEAFDSCSESERGQGSDGGGASEDARGSASAVVHLAVVLGLDYSIVAFTCSKSFIVSKALSEFLKLSGADWLDSLNDTPLDALGAGRSGERAIVTPVILKVDIGKELAHGNLLVILGVHGVPNGVQELVIFIATVLHVEEDSNDGTELGAAIFVSLALVLVNDMHLSVVELTHHSVLGGSMEMELERSEARLGLVSESDLQLGSCLLFRGSTESDSSGV